MSEDSRVERGERVRVRKDTSAGARTVEVCSVSGVKEVISISTDSVGYFEQIVSAAVVSSDSPWANDIDLIIEGVSSGRAMAIIPAGYGRTPKAMSVVGDWFISPAINLAKHVLAHSSDAGLRLHAEAVLREANSAEGRGD
jgi:hypothetical protein